MSLENIKKALPDYAKDLRINVSNVLSTENSPGLSDKQIWGSALASAMALKNSFLSKNLLEESQNILTETDLEGIKTAISLMGMNNVYYRSIHLAEDQELSQAPARLRMTMMNSQNIPQQDFEIYSLALSCLSGCGMCIKSHADKLKKEGLSVPSIQSVIRISAVIKGVHQSLDLDTI